MRLTWRDGVSTTLVAGILALFAAFTGGADLPLLSGPRAVGAVVFLTGMAVCAVASSMPGMPGWAMFAGSALGLTALVSAVITVAVASETALAVLVWVIVALWLLATVRHAVSGSPEGPVEPPKAEVLLEQCKDTLSPRLDVR